jgi:hypothetical protein
VTINLPKKSEAAVPTCRDYLVGDFDSCIGTVVEREIGKRFNCSLPFLKQNRKLEECR